MSYRRIIKNWLASGVLVALGLISAGGTWASTANFPGIGTYSSIQIVGHGWYIGGPSWLLSHALNQPDNPNKTWKIQAAPNNGHGAGFYNIINQTDNRCLAVGDGIYEITRGAASSAGYAVELSTCDYSNDHTQWIIQDNGADLEIKTNGHVSFYTNHCIQETDWIGGFDVWVRNFPACGSGDTALHIRLNGYTPAGPDHYEIVTPAASTINTASVTVKACTNAACSSLYATNGTVTLTTTNISGTTGTLSPGNPVTLAGGTASLTLSDTAGGVTQLSVAPASAPAAINTMQCFNGTARNATTSCRVTIAANIAPTVSLSATPTSGIAPASVTLTANATDTDGSVAKVEFFNGATLLATVTQAPYTYAWTNVVAGNYSLTAKATDNLGVATTSTAIAVTIATNQPPTVSLSATPTSGIAPASVTLTATAADADGSVAKVEFFNGATLLATVTQAPYTYAWTNVVTGNYSLTAKATDNLGAATTSGIVAVTVANNQPPTVSLSATPTSGIAPASVTLTATAADADGSVAKVEFFNGATLLATVTQAPYTYAWTNVGADNYSLTAKVTDNLGATTTSTAIVISIVNNTPPTVSLSATPTNATAPASVTLTATAADADGSVAKVEFYNGATLLATVTQAPYSYVWSNVAAGNYSLTAKATDNLGASTTSTAVNVSVANGVAQVYYIHPDQLNTPRLITDQNGNPVWKWESDPFGVTPPNQDPGNTGTPFVFNMRFPSQYFDQETNTFYNYFRDYDPTTGRYLESDPIGLTAGVNTYSYVGGNPLSYTDPQGLQVVQVIPWVLENWKTISTVVSIGYSIYKLHKASEAAKKASEEYTQAQDAYDACLHKLVTGSAGCCDAEKKRLDNAYLNKQNAALELGKTVQDAFPDKIPVGNGEVNRPW